MYRKKQQDTHFFRSHDLPHVEILLRFHRKIDTTRFPDLLSVHTFSKSSLSNYAATESPSHLDSIHFRQTTIRSWHLPRSGMQYVTIWFRDYGISQFLKRNEKSVAPYLQQLFGSSHIIRLHFLESDLVGKETGMFKVTVINNILPEP